MIIVNGANTYNKKGYNDIFWEIFAEFIGNANRRVIVIGNVNGRVRENICRNKKSIIDYVLLDESHSKKLQNVRLKRIKNIQHTYT